MRGEEYLNKPEQYALVYDKGNSWQDGLVVMKALPNHLARSRYGFSVSRRLGGAIKTTSQPVSSGIKRIISRRRRFTRFLTTALPTRRLTEKPYREKASPLAKALITVKSPTHELPLL